MFGLPMWTTGKGSEDQWLEGRPCNGMAVSSRRAFAETRKRQDPSETLISTLSRLGWCGGGSVRRRLGLAPVLGLATPTDRLARRIGAPRLASMGACKHASKVDKFWHGDNMKIDSSKT